MNGLEFVASMVGSLVWPIAAVVFAIIFFEELQAILKRPLRRAKAGPEPGM